MKTQNLSLILLITFLLFGCTKTEIPRPLDLDNNGMFELQSNEQIWEHTKSKVAVIYFTWDGCSFCNDFKVEMEKIANDPDLSNFVFFEAEKNRNKALIDSFNITGFPTIVVTNYTFEEFRLRGVGHDIKARLLAVKP